MPFTFEKTNIPEVILVTPKVFGDHRGFFLESYKASEFKNGGIDESFPQDNHSRSEKGVLRGLHYQMPPHAQGKLVRCLVGEIWDAVVDIRKSSPSFGQWTAATLSDENRRMLYVPPGFAHGFFTVSDVAEVFYKTTTEYDHDSERGIMWNDPDVAISWPSDSPKLSQRDTAHPSFKDADLFE